MNDEFHTVTRKKWTVYNSLQKRTKGLTDKGYDKDCPEVDIDKFLQRLEVLRDRMEENDYFITAMGTLKEAMLKLTLGEPPGVRVTINRIVCFGIGPFTRNFQALHQLAFILCAQSYLKIDEATFFDPVFRQSEKDILKKLGLEVMTENCEAKHQADVRTLYYMPHCPNCLTNNLLWKNWTPHQLKNVVLINNSFESLSCSKPDRILRLDSAYMLDIMHHGVELPLEDDYDVQNVFNDLSVHVFPANRLPPKDLDFWAKKDAPKYNDVEMISAEEFAKLSVE